MKNRINKFIWLMASACMVCAIPLSGMSAEPLKENAQGTKQKPSVSGKPAAGHRRGPKRISLSNAEGATLTLWKPDLTTLPLELKQGAITIPRTGMDNYHAIVAHKDWGNQKETIVRYEYLRGKPSGHTTRELTAAKKAEFEIVPQPVPREHLRYYSDQIWSFLVRFDDQPVSGIPVSIETTNGSTATASSDEKGIVKIHIPDDFPNVVEGERDMRDANFMLNAEYAKGDITYQTGLSATYRLNQSHWKSFELGALVIGLGMVAGGYIGRVRKTKGGRS